MRRLWIHVLLFVLTVASTLIVGGPAYSITIILILLGHEMGHYFMSRRYGIAATLPFFLPFPLSPFGTLGAVIRMHGTLSSRKALFDTGAAGPLVGLCLSIPAIVIGMSLSRVILLPQGDEGVLRLGNPLLFSVFQWFLFGEISPDQDILLHPIGYAGWVGLFVTALNLLPIGQLDGGHVAYALFGKRSRGIFLIAIIAMAFVTVFVNPGWFLLLILIILFGFRHPAPLDDQTPLDRTRKIIGGLIFLIFCLSFTPAPFPQFVDDLKQFLH